MTVRHYYKELGFNVAAAGFAAFSGTVGSELPSGYLVTSVGYDWAPTDPSHKFTPTRLRAVDLGQIALVAGWFEGPGSIYLEVVLSSGVENVAGN